MKHNYNFHNTFSWTTVAGEPETRECGLVDLVTVELIPTMVPLPNFTPGKIEQDSHSHDFSPITIGRVIR